MSKKPLQQYADEMFDAIGLPEFKQPLKNAYEAFEANGWPVEPGSSPSSIKIPSFLMVASLGSAYSYYDPATGRFAKDVTGPFGPNTMSPDDVEDPVLENTSARCWIVGTRAANKPNDDPIEQTLTPSSTLFRLAEETARLFMDQLMAALSRPPMPMAPGGEA